MSYGSHGTHKTLGTYEKFNVQRQRPSFNVDGWMLIFGVYDIDSGSIDVGARRAVPLFEGIKT